MRNMPVPGRSSRPLAALVARLSTTTLGVLILSAHDVKRAESQAQPEPVRYNEVIKYCKIRGWFPASEPPAGYDLAVQGVTMPGVPGKLQNVTLRFGWERVLSAKIIDPKKGHTYRYFRRFPAAQRITYVDADGKSRNYTVYGSPVVSAKDDTGNEIAFSRKGNNLEIALVFQQTIEVIEGKTSVRKVYVAQFATVFFDKKTKLGDGQRKQK
jgi:hypothetical protein